MEKKLIQGSESWQVKTAAIEANVTEQGGMMAPVVFTLGSRKVSPYYISPWAGEPLPEGAPAVLRHLRGDFFCLPFGGDNRVGAEDHGPHGEASFSAWKLESCTEEGAETVLSLGLGYTKCAGSVRKILRFGKSDPVIRTEHVISGFSGSYPLGHHATLAGGETEGKWHIRVKPFDFGLTDASPEAPCAGGEYFALKSSASFESLDNVSTRWSAAPVADVSVFPARKGFVDILALYRKVSPSDGWKRKIGWTVAFNREENYLWYSLKDSSLLPATVFWMENNGRHEAPWSGRNSCIGLEETCSFAATGRGPSIAVNSVSVRGIPTAVALSPDRPTSVRTIQGVLALDPACADIVALDLADDGRGTFRTSTGTAVPLPASLDLRWLCGE